MKTCIATIRRNCDGMTVEHKTEFDDSFESSTVEFIYIDGNRSCDCNRAVLFNQVSDPGGSWKSDDFPCGDGSFSLISLLLDGVELLAVNDDGEMPTPPNPATA